MQSRKTIYAYYGFACSEFGKGGPLRSGSKSLRSARGHFLGEKIVCSCVLLECPSLESVWGLFVRMWLTGSMEDKKVKLVPVDGFLNDIYCLT
ncbi:hypothetical protein NL676_030645 [Syzygium grande]|nr:hypothetical protein NL676_030645 [Syzygium grande]